MAKLGKGKLEKVMKSPKVAAAVQKKAAAVEAFAKGISPVFDSGRDKRAAPPMGAPGAYRDAWHTTDMSGDDGPRARVSNNDWKAQHIEFGWGRHMRPFAILAKTKANFR